jgi:hypothetical protein
VVSHLRTEGDERLLHILRCVQFFWQDLSVPFFPLLVQPSGWLMIFGYPLKAGHPLEGSFYEGFFVKRF